MRVQVWRAENRPGLSSRQNEPADKAAVQRVLRAVGHDGCMGRQISGAVSFQICECRTHMHNIHIHVCNDLFHVDILRFHVVNHKFHVVILLLHVSNVVLHVAIFQFHVIIGLTCVCHCQPADLESILCA